MPPLRGLDQQTHMVYPPRRVLVDRHAMARGTHSAPKDAGVSALLSNPRYEVMPFDSFDDQLTHLPEGATITITASPQLDLPPTIEKAEEAAVSLVGQECGILEIRDAARDLDAAELARGLSEPRGRWR